MSFDEELDRLRAENHALCQTLAAVLLSVGDQVLVTPHDILRSPDAVLVKEDDWMTGGYVLSARILGREESAVAGTSVPRLAS